MAMTDYLEDELLDHVFDTGAFTAPSSLFLALLQSASADADDPTVDAGKEIQAGPFPTGGYSRQGIAVVASVGGAVANTAQLTFGAATTDWPNATHAWLVDTTTASSGNILFHGALGAAKDAAINDTIVFAAGDIDITFD